MPIRNKEKRAKKKERSPDLFSALIRLSSLAFSQTDPDRIISQALKDIRKIFNAKLCWLFLVEDNEIKFKSLGETKSRKNLIRSQLLPKLSPEILKRTYPIICNRVGELYKKNRAMYSCLHGKNIHKFMGVPLRKDRKLMGVLNVARDSDSPSFTKEDSKSLALLGTIIVMTKLKQAEEESRQSPDFLEAIIDNIPNPIFIKDKKHRWVILNQAGSDLVGYPREKMLGKSDYDFFPKEQADFFWKKDEEMFRTGKVIEIPEEPITDKEGNLHYLHTKKAPLKDSSGRITHLVGIIEDITKRKKAEEALKLFSHSVDSSVDGIAMGNPESRITYVNETFAKMFGYSREELIGKEIAFIYAQDQMPKLKKALKAALEGGWRGELVGKKKDGKLFPVAISASRVSDDEGKVIAHMASHTDIAERKRAEEKLKESEEKYKTLVEISNDMIFTVDLKGNFLFTNKAFEKNLGYSDEEIKKINGFELVHPEDLEIVKQQFAQLVEGKSVDNMEYRYKTKNGSYINILNNASPIFNSQGNIAATLGIARDITERKRAEQMQLVLYNIANAVNTTRDLNELFKSIQEELGTIVDTTNFYIALYDKENDTISFPYHVDEKDTYTSFPARKTLTSYVIKKAKPLLATEKIKEKLVQAGEVETIGAPSKVWLGVPLKTGEEVIGVVAVQSYTDASVYTERDLEILRFASEQIAIAIQRKQAEVALRESENKYRMLLENLPQKIFFKNKNSVYISCNDNFAQDLNIKLDEITGKTDYDFFPKKLAEKYEADDKRIMKSGKIEDIEETYIQDGQKVFVHTVKTPIKGKNGNIVGILGIFWDITDRKQAEKVLIRNERIARERARLLTDLRNLNQIDDILTRVCEAARDSGLFERAVMTLHDQKRQIMHLGQVGLPPDVVKRARQAPPIDKNLRAQIANKKFRISDSFFIPAEAGVDFSKTGRHISQKRRKSVGGNWQRGDELFVPLRDFSGKIMGYLSVDTPTDGRRPDIETIQALEMLVEAGAARVREVEAHKTLRRSEEYFRSLIENATDIVAIVNSDGVLRYQSPSLERVLGYKPEETIGKKAFEFIHPDDVPGVTRIFARVIQNPSVIQTAEYRARHKDGSWHNLEATGRSLLDNPAVRGIIINYRDITDRKQAEEALRESEGKYRELVNTSVDGVISVNPQMKIILWNPGAERIFGYTEKEVLGQGLMKIVPERYRKAKEKGFVEFRKTGSGPVLGKTLELEGLRKDGTEVPIELSVSSRRIGETYIATSIARDITERKRAEEALRKSEGRYRTLVETAQEGIGISDSEENLIFVNQAFADLLGYQKENLLGKNLKEISDEAQFSIFRRETEKRKKGEFSKYEAKLLTKRGKPKYVYISAAPLLDEDGSFVGTLGVLSDLTELKKAQEYNILLDTSRALSQTLKFDQVLKTGTQKMIEVLNADRCAVLLTEGAPSGSKITVQVFPQKTEALAPVFNLRFTKELFSSYKRSLQKQKYIQVFDARSNSVPELGRKILRKAKIASALIIPMFVGKKILGILHVGTAKKTKPFGTEEVRLVLTMVNQVAIALENCRLMEDLKKEHSRITEQAKALKRQTREKDILLKVSRALSKTMDLDEVSKVASRVVGSAMGVERCAVTLTPQDGNQLEIKDLFFKEPTKPSKLIGTQLSWDDIPTMSKAIKKGKPFTINNISDLPSESNTRKYLLKAGIKSVLGAGMFFGKKLIGLLSITSIKEYKTFTQDEMKLVQTTANQIAVAIENARLLQVVKKHTQDLKELSSQLMKVQEKERKRIAQELHDEVGQMLQSMKMNLDRIKRNFNSKPKKLEGIEDWLLDTEKLLSETIEDIRTLTFDLRPSMLDDFGLIPTLRWYIENYSRRSNVKVSLKAKDKRYRFPPDIEITLYRIMQEALTNVSKHAQATEVSVLVSQKNSTAFLSVRDNGIGFDTSQVVSAPKGMGLLNVKERVDLLGGSFEIISHPRKGTTLNIKFPFSEVKHEEDQINGR